MLCCKQVMHSDLKASNVLLDAGWTAAKLGDVGVAKCMARQRQRASVRLDAGLCGTGASDQQQLR